MPTSSCPVFCFVFIALLILTCMVSGCFSLQARPATALPGASREGDHFISIDHFAFEPSVATVKTGTEIQWSNHDSTEHLIVSDTGSPASFTSGLLLDGAFYRLTLTRTGTYRYHCSIHPSMNGTIIVEP